MDLLLWRHAEAVDSLPDEQRELTTRGRRQAESIAEWLAERRPKDLRIIVSPAKRALQTARLFTSRVRDLAEGRYRGRFPKPADCGGVAGSRRSGAGGRPSADAGSDGVVPVDRTSCRPVVQEGCALVDFNARTRRGPPVGPQGLDHSRIGGRRLRAGELTCRAAARCHALTGPALPVRHPIATKPQ